LNKRKNHAHLTLFCFADSDCASIPDELDLRKILESFIPTLPTTPENFTPDIYNITTPFPIPEWPDRFNQVDYTNTLMWLYAGFNGAWAVTCIIAIVSAAMNVSSWFAYLPWILLAAANIVLDVIATVNFVNDALDSQTVQDLLENVIGLNLPEDPDGYLSALFKHDMFSSVEGLTMIPSVIMLILTSRLGILWLLNVLFLICVLVSVHRIPNKKGKSRRLATYPHTEPINRGLHNRAYIEEPQTKERGQEYDYIDGHIYNRPDTGGDLGRSSTTPQPLTNRGAASSVAVLGPNLHSPATQSNYLELLHPQHRLQEQSAPADNYGRQAQNRMPVPSDLKGSNGADEQMRAPHIRRTDSESSSQPYKRNRPVGSIALPRVDLYSPATKTDAEYWEPRQGFRNSLASADNYKIPSSRRLSAPQDIRGDNGPDGQRNAPHLHRSDSNNSHYRPPVPPKNLQRQSASFDEVDRPQEQISNASRPSSLPPEVRGQLPWSYFGPRKTQIKPMPIQESVDEEEMERPPVPVPDYTLHFGKSDRPVQPTWPDDGISFPDSVVNHRRT